MNNFFCEIPLAGPPQSSQLGLSTLFSQQFPFQSGPCSTHQNPTLFLWGNVQVSTQEGHSVLYLVGEIYNLSNLNNAPNAARSLHELVQQQGTSALSQCNGRFFVVYHDLREQTIDVFNDQMGVQQVFYHQYAGGIIMASELKFLLAHPQCPQTINWEQSIRRSLGFNSLDHCQSQNAWFMGVEMLPEASRIRIQPHKNEIQIAPYWKPTYTPHTYDNVQEVIESYMALLDDAVQLRCQDGEEAHSFLSGGLDSSIICALAAPATADRHKKLHTYSALTQTTYLEQTTEMVFNLANTLQCQNTQVLMPYHRIATDPLVWKKRLWRSESPAAHTDSITKTLLHHAIGSISPDARYMLTGTGSDQLNGGLVRWFINDDEEHPENNWPNLTARLAEEAIKNSVPEHHYTLWGLRHVLADSYIRDLGQPNYGQPNWRYYVQNKLYMNQFTLLWDENRAGSTQNRSVRYPFLDYRFMEFIGNVPAEFHSQLFYDKQILRIGSARYLPDYIINKPKTPANWSDYDNRIGQYKAFASHNNREVVEELMANNAVIGTVISRQKLQAEVERLEKNTDLQGWLYMMHLLNLGVLEKLPQQTESSMRYEDVLDQGSLYVSTLDATSIAQIEAKLNIVTEADKLASAVGFKSGSSLVADQFSNTLYLVKDKVLHYEIDNAEPHWKAFLLAINGEKTIGDILAGANIVYTDVQEYLDVCLKEGFLTLTVLQPA